MYENENQSFDNREQDYHYTNTPEQQAPTRPRKKNTNAARIAKKAGAKVVGTGRSDFPNQVNNVVAFPGIFKGALEGRATQITEEMKLAASLALASLVPDDELNEDNILPEAFDPRVADVVSAAVKEHIHE